MSFDIKDLTKVRKYISKLLQKSADLVKFLGGIKIFTKSWFFTKSAVGFLKQNDYFI